MQSIYKGINFVGFIVKPHHLLIRNRIVKSLKSKLYCFNRKPIPPNYETFKTSLKEILATINSYYGQFKYANTFNLRKSLFTDHFGVLKSYLVPDSPKFNFFKIKKCPEKSGKARIW